MIHVGDIMSTTWGVQYRGGTQITKDFFPHGTHDILHVHHDIAHGTEYPPRYSR